MRTIVQKAFNNVFQEAVLHDLCRDPGYWPVVSCVFLLAFPSGVALAVFQAPGASLITLVKMVGSYHISQLFQHPQVNASNLVVWVHPEKTVTGSSPSAGSSFFLCLQWFRSKLCIRRLKGERYVLS